ncbi:hypothetical protein CN205_13945 [Sinorhizobium meliloti]|uniref:hypothetical protein n=1 Tax=Rhizobium meliloti TaxID=382 RepID=UPI000FD93F6D|nr:hypothetical protein [Sinorhizobium meliloti]RVI06485.1 hypothetical protein CN205_13945 [Sinorhizobium meliloti]
MTINAQVVETKVIEINVPGPQGPIGPPGIPGPQGTTDYNDLTNKPAPPYVANRTALKAIDTTKDTVVFLAAPGREGQFVWKGGDYSAQVAADTQEGIYIKADAIAATAGAWVRESGWQISGADVRWFGAAVDDANDDASAINAALSLGATVGFKVMQPRGTSAVGSTITLKNGAIWVGDNYLSNIKRKVGHSGALVKSENFDSLTGTTDAFAAGVPERVVIDKITFDGNYQNVNRTAYVQSIGEGIRLFVRDPVIKVRVFNTPGVGVWSECPGGNGPSPLQPGFSREAEIEIYTHQTQYEGVIWKGPPDVEVEWILQADAGSRIVADQLNGKVNSPNFGPVNGGKTDGVVFDGMGAEIGAVHAFGNFGGGGIDWRNGGRINADLLMAESCHFGGINISGSALGVISKLDVHRTGGFGGDTTADFIYAGTGANNYGLEIGVCAIYRQNAANTGSRNGVEITGDFLDIGVAKVDLGSTATAGHGILIDNDQAQWITINGGEVARCKGTAPDGLASSGVYRKATGTGSNVTVKVQVRDCDIGFRSAGTPRLESIDIQAYLNTGQTLFDGDVRANNGQKWDIRGTVNGVWKGSEVDLSFTFDSMLATEQSVTIAHNLIAAPSFGKITAALVDNGTPTVAAANTPFYFVSDYNATDITVKYKQGTATGTNTSPRVWLHAEI